MKRSIVTCTMVVGALLVALLPSSAFAICPRDQILQHAVGGYFTNCPDARPVKAYAYAVNSTAAADRPRAARTLLLPMGRPVRVSRRPA